MTTISGGREIKDVVLNSPAGAPYQAASSSDAALSKSYYDGAVPMTPGTNYTPGIGVAIVATVAGNVQLALTSGTITFPVAVGLTIVPFGATQVTPGGTTATATYTKLT